MNYLKFNHSLIKTSKIKALASFLLNFIRQENIQLEKETFYKKLTFWL